MWKCNELITEKRRLFAWRDDTALKELDLVVTNEEVDALQAKALAEENVFKNLKYKKLAAEAEKEEKEID